MPPSEPIPLNWAAITLVVLSIINISGWFVVHFLTKRREAQKDRRARDEAAAAQKDALAAISHVTDAEREILNHCASIDGWEKGHVWIMRVDAFGSWVRAGKHDFFDQADASIQARYLDAFESLVARGFFRHQSGMAYQLTGIGYEKAQKNT